MYLLLFTEKLVDGRMKLEAVDKGASSLRCGPNSICTYA